jgi:hypothetical protein
MRSHDGVHVNHFVRLVDHRLCDQPSIYSRCWPVLVAALILMSPCASATSLDAGQVAPCSGVLLSADQVRQALTDRAEVKARRDVKCVECLPCPKIEKPKTMTWAFGGAIVGALSSAIVGLILVSSLSGS